MSSRLKFQVGKVLDQRLKNLISGEHNANFGNVSKAYILGFINGTTINYIGLAQDLHGRHPGIELIGLAYLKNKPTDDDVKQDIAILIEFLEKSHNDDGLAILENDTSIILGSILICQPDTNSSAGLSRMIWTREGPVEKCPKISVLESSKIYAHSALASCNISISLNLSEDNFKSINNILDQFHKDSKEFNIIARETNFSSNNLLDKSTTEALYEHLIPPNDVTDDDVISQMATNKKEREAAIKKVCDKWRNKQKERRSPFEFEIRCDNLNKQQEGSAKIDLKLYLHIHMNDTLSKTLCRMLALVQDNVRSLGRTMAKFDYPKSLASEDLKFCTFKPSNLLDHFVYDIYLLPSHEEPRYELLENQRNSLHDLYLAPTKTCLFRYSQRITNLSMQNADEQKGYLCNVHKDIESKSNVTGGLRSIIDGTYTYHHYMQNNINDSGWGCAYRSLQTIISWFKHQGYIYSQDVKPYKVGDAKDKMSQLRLKLNTEARVPTHEEIQAVLVDIGDKSNDFIGSKKWIGSQEVCFVLDHLYGISSKFIAVSSGSELVGKARDLSAHFKGQSTPIMIGGGVLAHTIIGTDFNEKNGDISYLILDPHYTDEESLDKILKKGWCGWKKNSFWDKSAFYNLCLPQKPKVI